MIADGFYNMDCFREFNLIDDKSIDLILCDLPFGTTQNDRDIILPFDRLWQQYERIMQAGRNTEIIREGLQNIL